MGVEMEFLVPGNAGGFLMGKRAQRMRAMGMEHGVGIQITRQTDKHLRSLRLYSTTPQGIVSYWEDLWAKVTPPPPSLCPPFPCFKIFVENLCHIPCCTHHTIGARQMDVV